MELKSLFIMLFFFFFFFSLQSLLATQAFQTSDYRDALSKSILFYEGMRSGRLPANQRASWRGDSALMDGQTQNVNLRGGYYDSGDNIKFGFPMAFTITMLSWSVIEFEKGLKRAGELQNARNAVRWGTDYLLKAWRPPSTLWVQVGEPNSDHSCWERPEDMDTPRTAYQVDPSAPGSDVAAETSAALAAASMVFRYSKPEYSQRLLNASKQVFEFADRYRGRYSDFLGSVVSPFYTSYSGYNDELLWGAVWLHRATNDARYLQYIEQHGNELGGPSTSYNTLSWDNKFAGVDVLLAKEFLAGNRNSLGVYKSLADQFVCSAMPGRATLTPGGLFYQSGSNNLQYVTNNAFLLITYSGYLKSSRQRVTCGGTTVFQPQQLTAFAKQQIDYILGNNPRRSSYMVGFGNNFPRRVHHRAASLPSIHVHPQRIGCGEGFNWLHTSNLDPNLLVGALTGGPDVNDNYSDNRDDYSHSEPSTYTNAALVGALAYLS